MCWGVFYGPKCGLFWWMFHWNLGRKCLLLLLDEEFHQCQLDQAHWLYCSHHLRLYCFLPAWSISYWQGCAVLHFSRSVVSCLTLCDPMDCSPPGSSVHRDSPGKNAGVGCHWQGYEALMSWSLKQNLCPAAQIQVLSDLTQVLASAAHILKNDLTQLSFHELWKWVFLALDLWNNRPTTTCRGYCGRESWIRTTLN